MNQRVKQRLTANLGLKVAALMMAFVTWIAIHEVTNFEAVFNDVPITFRLEEGWAVMDTSVKAFEVRFRGSNTKHHRHHGR